MKWPLEILKDFIILKTFPDVFRALRRVTYYLLTVLLSTLYKEKKYNSSAYIFKHQEKSRKPQKWARAQKRAKKKLLPAKTVDIEDVHLYSKEKLKNKLWVYFSFEFYFQFYPIVFLIQWMPTVNRNKSF